MQWDVEDPVPTVEGAVTWLIGQSEVYLLPVMYKVTSNEELRFLSVGGWIPVAGGYRSRTSSGSCMVAAVALVSCVEWRKSTQRVTSPAYIVNLVCLMMRNFLLSCS